ncbi:MAG: FecR domain-containing protein [Leptospiraceae bacterium]|nr:FecR domain-containing protein [Leptospiraceae bacterium]
MQYTPVNTEIRNRSWNKHHTVRPVFTALLGIAVLALMSTHCSESRKYGIIEYSVGETYMVPAGSEARQPATIGQAVGENDTVGTGPASAMELTIRNIGTVRLGENTELFLAELQAQNRIRVRVDAGNAGFFVRTEENYELEAALPTMVASVRGTEFILSPESPRGEPNWIALFDGAIVLADDKDGSMPLEGPGEVSLPAGGKLDASLIKPLSPEAIALMDELKASIDKEPRPDTGRLPQPGQPGSDLSEPEKQ